MSSPTPLLVVWWSVNMRNLWVWLHGVDLPFTSMRGSPWWESGEASVHWGHRRADQSPSPSSAPRSEGHWGAPRGWTGRLFCRLNL